MTGPAAEETRGERKSPRSFLDARKMERNWGCVVMPVAPEDREIGRRQKNGAKQQDGSSSAAATPEEEGDGREDGTRAQRSDSFFPPFILLSVSLSLSLARRLYIRRQFPHLVYRGCATTQHRRPGNIIMTIFRGLPVL